MNQSQAHSNSGPISNVHVCVYLMLEQAVKEEPMACPAARHHKRAGPLPAQDPSASNPTPASAWQQEMHIDRTRESKHSSAVSCLVDS